MARKIINGVPVPYMRGNVIYEHIYELTLYDDSENANFQIIFDRFKNHYPKAQYVYIHHTKDTLEDGTPKKPHWHLLIVFERERSIKKFAESLSLPLNLVEWKAYLDKSVQYLIHMNNPEKAQYDPEELEGNWNYMIYLGGDFSSSYINELSDILNFVRNNKAHINFYNIFIYCLEHNLLKTYKSWYTQIKDIYLE